jgi:predicted HicB family RNase H-like nuclease
MKKPIKYTYLIRSISDDPNDPAYKAYIPAFNGIVYGESLEELEEGIYFTIKTEIEELKKEGKPIPEPDIDKETSGRILLRIDPALHEDLIFMAKANQISLNKYIEQTLWKSSSFS